MLFILKFILSPLALMSLAALVFGRDFLSQWWILDLFNHWTPQIILLSIIILFLFFLPMFTNFLLSVLGIAALLYILSIFGFLPHSIASYADTKLSDSTISVMQYNVLYSNKEQGPIIALIDKWNPDIILLAEADSAWDDFAINLTAYPYQCQYTKPDIRDTRILSKFPLEQCHSKLLSGGIRPASSAIAQTNLGPVQLMAVHTASPTSADRFSARNKEIKALASQGAPDNIPLLIGGDFNSTLWSSSMAPMLQAGFVYAYTRQASWPAFMGNYGITIDYIFTKGLVPISKIMGAGLGSDHRPQLSFFKT